MRVGQLIVGKRAKAVGTAKSRAKQSVRASTRRPRPDGTRAARANHHSKFPTALSFNLEVERNSQSPNGLIRPLAAIHSRRLLAMTALGPALLDLSTKGHRRQGMNRQNKYTSLHGDRIKNAGKASDGSKSPAEKLEEEDVYALPKDSSSDNNADVAESDGPGRVKTSQRKSMLNGKGKSFTKPAVISYPGGRPPEPQMNAGNRSDGEENGDEEPARSKKKRKLEDLRDEDMMGLFAPSQPQNSKRGYGLVKNIHTSTYGKKGARRGVNAKDGKSQKQDERNGFKTLDTGTLLTDGELVISLCY